MAEPTEVGLRSPDAPNTSEDHKKDFVVPTDEVVFVDHEDNERKVRADLFSKGMRPTGDISHRSAKDKPSKGSTTITYTVGAVVLDHEVEPDILHQDVEGEVPVPGEEDETAAEEQDEDEAAVEEQDEDLDPGENPDTSK
jgi:hypothetical protein